MSYIHSKYRIAPQQSERKEMSVFSTLSFGKWDAGHFKVVFKGKILDRNLPFFSLFLNCVLYIYSTLLATCSAVISIIRDWSEVQA